MDGSRGIIILENLGKNILKKLLMISLKNKYFKEIIDDILEEYEERKMKEVIPKEYLAKFYDFTDS